MGYKPYKTIVLLPQGHTLTFSDLIKKLRHKFSQMPAISFGVDGPRALIRHDAWFLSVFWEDEPHVVIESQDIADRFAKTSPDHDRIAACSRRITMLGQSDPNMDYFSDYVVALEALESIPGVFIFDPEDGELRKTD